MLRPRASSHPRPPGPERRPRWCDVEDVVPGGEVDPFCEDDLERETEVVSLGFQGDCGCIMISVLVLPRRRGGREKTEREKGGIKDVRANLYASCSSTPSRPSHNPSNPPPTSKTMLSLTLPNTPSSFNHQAANNKSHLPNPKHPSRTAAIIPSNFPSENQYPTASATAPLQSYLSTMTATFKISPGVMSQTASSDRVLQCTIRHITSIALGSSSGRAMCAGSEGVAERTAADSDVPWPPRSMAAKTGDAFPKMSECVRISRDSGPTKRITSPVGDTGGRGGGGGGEGSGPGAQASFDLVLDVVSIFIFVLVFQSRDYLSSINDVTELLLLLIFSAKDPSLA